ncbi:Hypothetical predicted protein [Mytilus galloprovincialis]|uniref:C1q domain-containing protein n=1 Tax=Mytilus galloprovincialis TaxID=29158 RepID=A0A8B6DS61_MYTGA|nr:Hypothetical predicted protein [Mytilus galloprovincialis]
MLAFYFLLLASAYSFLLENPQGNGGTTITNQYLTISKFYEEMKLQQADTANVHRETIKLRHDTDNSLTLLTSQLQQKFDLLDKKLAEIARHNDSNSDFINLEQKYIQLEQKYSNLEQNYITQGHELAMLKNTLQTNHNTSIKDLGTQIRTLQTNHNASITNLGIELKNVEKNQNIHFVDVESKMRAAAIMNNQTFIHLQQQIDNSTEQVAMTAHPSSNSNKAGIIKFDNVAFSVGIKNLTAFKNSGKFVCEKEGLYILSVKIYSNTNGAHFYISLNGNTISYTKISFNGNHPSAMENTSTAVLTVQLRLNDSVWVFYPRASHVAGSAWSTFTIVKIK